MKSHTSIAALAASLAFAASPVLAQTEINFWHAMGGALGEKVEEIATDFNEMQDEFKVVPTYKGNYTENMTAAIAAFRAGEQPHIVQVFEVGTATMMAAQGAVKPVYGVMGNADIDWDADAYLPAVKSYYTTPEGQLLSLPFNSSTPVMWYNKDMLDAAGVEEVPQTWDDMFAAAEKLKANGADCAFSFGWQSWVMLENYLAWHDEPIGTQQNGFAGLDTEFVFNESTDLTELLQRIADSQADGMFKYGGRRGDSLPLFTTGECAMWMNSSAYYAGISEQAEFEFGQAMLPVNTAVRDEAQNSIIGGATLWVLEGHDDAEYQGVAEFFNYMSTPEVQADWHQSSGYVPITTAAYELSKEQGFYDENPGTDTAIKQLSLNEPTENSRGIRFGNFVQIRDIINEELEALWAGDQTANEALDNAADRGNDLLREFQDTNS
ncbi:sn-glycerol-3-phosphate ABC transporter substrate-binding protein UgpB [Roseovarius indicus]|uniref:sn-glycerol-3-phosphate-binding periplasmic protein UgpB n=1 Tax=Roseovarius indicus TaxID=540747 RepID=A0A0T5P5S8_9RHOB|nr:sn-glycerol-3-phosphate ABC transporter substrate-binding protein UgpB [Roseovarius indicus]KRS16420.1 glycerol-3-phosphate ABC transporter substrate-binding protein [Roseovarius indicus]QEW28400.1 sn-glycerol-3-phosphate-binding periplasmic protein UgpB precursor [Roseovarius indicus]SFE11394.1 carbohydrate ABC transporter substrate-binding protein, CUT1 family [Roseovarius indicus]